MQFELTQILAAVGTTLLAIVTVWKTLRSQPREDRLLDADAAAKFSEVAAKSAERNKKLLERVHNLEDKYDALDDKYDILENEVMFLRRLMADWEEGINLLIDQLSEAGIEPAWRPEPSKLSNGD